MEHYKDYWCSKDSQVYQFIGSDNIYFYGVAEMAMFMALKEGEITSDPEDGEMQLPILVANNHILFLDKKASSSGSIKPPMAADLLNLLYSRTAPYALARTGTRHKERQLPAQAL
ncbi:MAG: class I tRNA ligase family protein [[Eubacterium] siraeum]